MRIQTARREADRAADCPRRRRYLFPAFAVAAIAPILTAPSAYAAFSGTNSSTVTITPELVRSISVTSDGSSFAECVDQVTMQSISTLNIPGGLCRLGTTAGDHYVTITNGAAPGHIEINGGDAVPSDGGTHWTLIPPPGSQVPDAFYEDSSSRDTGSGGVVTADASCDQTFHANTADPCAATSNDSSDESLQILGPSETTDKSPTFTITTTWTAVP